MRPWKSLTPLVLLALLGCSPYAPEDRTIEFSHNGQQVAFQHDDHGVFVADRLTGTARKIFEAGDRVLVTSRPRSSPIDGRMIFTTAELDENPPAQGVLASPGKDQELVEPAAIFRYTCWVTGDLTGDADASPAPLFTAKCDDLNYVTSGVAALWYPDGQRILYIVRTESDVGKHTLYEFDLRTKQSNRVVPFEAPWIAYGWSTDGRKLACVVFDNRPSQDNTALPSNPQGFSIGIWIGSPDEQSSWIHVPFTESTMSSSGSPVPSLKEAHPVWSRDSSQFAFVVLTPQPHVAHRVYRVNATSREVTLWLESEGPVRDVRFASDGSRLGLIESDPKTGSASLKLVDRAGAVQAVPQPAWVTAFAGFSSSGQQIAYVTPASDVDANGNPKNWSHVFQENQSSRETIWILKNGESGPGRKLFSGMRVSFPGWAPAEDRVACWLTFVPRYRSVVSLLSPGDPAATIDTHTGAINWHPVDQFEQRQVGNYYLAQGDIETAWEWYVRASFSHLPRRHSASPPRGARANAELDSALLFESICLRRLGRHQEAEIRRNEFEAAYFANSWQSGITSTSPPVNSDPNANIQDRDSLSPDVMFGSNSPLMARVVYDLFVAEIFLAANAVDLALTHFEELAKDTSGSVRLSAMLVHSQLLLLAGKHDEFASYWRSLIAADAIAHLKNVPVAKTTSRQSDQSAGAYFGLCLLPLCQSEFLKCLSPEVITQQKAFWEQLRDQESADSIPALAADLVLRAISKSSNNPTEARLIEQRTFEQRSIEQRIVSNPFFAVFVPNKSFDLFDK